MVTKKSKSKKAANSRFKWEAGDVQIYASIADMKKKNPGKKFISVSEMQPSHKRKKK